MGTKHKLILLATILASGMAFLDGTVVSIATPVIQKSFHADITQIQWLTNSFALALAALVLVSGSLGDHFGIKKIFSIGILLFTVASMLCSLSSSIDMLIFFRAIQGIGSAMMIPGSLAIINYSFPPERRGRAIGLWSGLSGGVAALGPLVGGYLVQYFSWQSIFFINLPLGALCLFLTWKYVTESKNHESTKLDFLGTIILTLGLFGVCFGLIEGPVFGWINPLILSSLVGGILLLLYFINYERKLKNPLIPLEIFKSNLVVGANLVTFFLYFALYGIFFFLALNFQQAQMYGPLIAGLGYLPFILIITFGSGYGGTLADKIGPRLPMIVGPFIVAIAFSLLIIPGSGANYFISFLPALILFGIGMAIVIAPLTKSALSVQEKFSGSASGVNNAISRIAALLAVSILGAVVLTVFRTNLPMRLNQGAMSETEKLNILSQMEKLGAIETTDPASKKMVIDSFIYSFRIAMAACAGLAFLSAFISYLTIKNPKKN